MEILEKFNAQVLPLKRIAVSSETTISKSSTLDESEKNAVLEFAPNVILDFSFLTKEKLGSMDQLVFRRTNELLTDRLIELSNLPSVRRVMYVSSGAATYPFDALEGGFEANPYGFLKRTAELRLQKLVDENGGLKSVSILRAWSVSGAHVRNPSGYLFSSLVTQALMGSITLSTETPVFRRYVSVRDALVMGLANFQNGKLTVLDTGGELVEARELAILVRELVNPRAALSVNEYSSSAADNYFSDNASWLEATSYFGYQPTSLVGQIEEYSKSLSRT
jgi:nucleoside-diphosphate-sugar epimerase